MLFDAPQPGVGQPLAPLGERTVVMVVSAGTEPSRPHVAANLAAIYGEAGQRVIVVSTGDVEAVSGVRLVDTRPKVIRRDDVEAQLQPSRLEFVSRLPLGTFVANSGELVTRGRAVLDAARTLCDVVIVEVPRCWPSTMPRPWPTRPTWCWWWGSATSPPSATPAGPVTCSAGSTPRYWGWY